LKGGENMKKVWQQPKLEALDINMTMWNLKGYNHDGAWTEHLSNLVENDDGTLSEAQMS
jgi:hypothetical protein